MSTSRQQPITRTRKIALSPSPKQLRLLEQHAAHARDAYNWTLAWYKDRREAGEPCPVSMLFPMWQGARGTLSPHYQALCPSAAQYAVYALGYAIEAWQDSARANHFPRFHRRDRKPAFRADKGKGTVRCQGRRIQLPVIGSLRMLRPLRPQGRVLEVTLTHEAGRWWACVALEMGRPTPSSGTRVIGVDAGLGTIAVCSDGTRYEIPEELKSLRRDVGRLRRRLTRQVEGSARHGRVRQQLEYACDRAMCLREEAQHRAAREIVARADMVVMEGLDIRDMMSRGAKCLAGGIARAAMGGLRHKIAYRCEASGVRLVEAPGDYPSSRMCSGCRALQDMPLGKRVYDCARCGLVMDRDANAARNLQRYGESQLPSSMQPAACGSQEA